MKKRKIKMFELSIICIMSLCVIEYACDDKLTVVEMRGVCVSLDRRIKTPPSKTSNQTYCDNNNNNNKIE